jgi:hypothetical protein
MTETATDPSQSTPPQPETPQAPQFRMLRANLPNLLATLYGYTSPAAAALDEKFAQHRETHPSSTNPVAEVPHFDAIRDWCAANPSDAARIVLCAVYLVSGRHVVQEQVDPTVGPAATDAVAPEGEGAPPA